MGLKDKAGLEPGGLRNLLSIEVADAIPDSAIYQWDATELSLSDRDSVSSWTDEIGGLELTGAATYREAGINEVPAVEFDGTDDTLDSDIDTETQGYEVLLVAFTNRADGTSGSSLLGWDGNRGFFIVNRGGNDEEGIRSDGATELQAGDSTTEPHIWSLQFDTTSSVIRRDGSDLGSGDAGDGDLSNTFALGSLDDNSNFLDGRIGEVVVYDTVLSASERADEEDRLSEKWGITV